MKKKLTKVEKWIIEEVLRQNQRFEDTCRQFYSDGIVEDFKFPAVEEDALESLYEERELYTYEDEESRKKAGNIILQILQNILEGKKGNIEVRFDKGMVYAEGNKYELSNTIAMIRVGSNWLPVFFKAGDRYDAKIFIEDGSEYAFLVLKDKEKDKDSNDNAVIFFLDEFYLLGICHDGGMAEETGMMIGYDYMDKYAYFDIVEEVIFSKIKELLVADWLQEKWKKAKEAHEKKTEDLPR